MNNVFYIVKPKDKLKLLRECEDLCYNHKVDKLDMSISWARQKTDISYNDSLKMFDKHSHFVFILRNDPFGVSYYETGFNTVGDPSHYLFVYLSGTVGLELVKKYDMEVLR